MQDFLHYAQKMCAEIGSQANIHNPLCYLPDNVKI